MLHTLRALSEFVEVSREKTYKAKFTVILYGVESDNNTPLAMAALKRQGAH